MRKRGWVYLRTVCFFLIYLVIIPVLYTANVFAYFNAGIQGYDGVVGFRKATEDVTLINVSASIEGEIVSASQVKVISDPTRRFDCREGNLSAPTVCEIRVPGNLPPGPHLYEVQLFHADMSEAEPKVPLVIYVDNLPPTIHSFGLLRNGSDVDAVFQVSDRACETCPPTVCSGISRVEFLLNYVKVGEFVPENHTCLIPSNQTPLAVPKTEGTSTKRICIDAYDALNQKSSVCEDIVMDFSPPEMLNASLWLGDYPVKYTKGEPIGNVELKVYLKEASGLNLSTLVADLSSLNSRPEFSDIYRNIDMSERYVDLFDPNCSNISEDVYVCTWKKLLLLIPAAATPEIILSVSDSLGNVMNSTQALPLVFDNTKPVVSGFRTGIADDRGRYWVGVGNNTIYVDIAEDGSGFNDRKVFLDLTSFGPQPYADNKVVLAPNNCTEGWSCSYNFVTVANHASGDLLSFSLTFGSSDDANNPVEGTTAGGFYFDAEAPQIIAVENSTICPTAPDSIDLTINVSERYSGGARVEVSAENLSTSVFPQTFDCEETDTAGIWTCDITIDNLVTYYVDGGINVTLIDRAGNRNSTMLKQEVCEAAPGTPPNVITTLSCNILPPTGIDRQVAERIPFPLFIRPTLKPTSTSASIQEVRVAGCTSPEGTFSDEYIIDELNFEDPTISAKISLGGEAFGNDTSEGIESTDVECELHLIVRAGKKVYQEPEIETVYCQAVPLHGTVFGGLNSSLSRTIEDITRQIQHKEDEIEDYEGWLDVLGTFCTLAELSAKIAAALQILREVIWVPALILHFLGALQTVGDNLYYWTCKITEWVTGLVMTLIWNVDANPQSAWSSTGYYFKILCAISMCRLSEQQTIVELIGGAAGADWSTYNSKSYDMFIENNERPGAENEFPDGGGGIPPGVMNVIFNAYRSKEAAQWSACLPGYVFALKKERQLLCMKRNCYNDYVAAGFSPDICNWAYGGRQCLYVHSAAYKISGDSVVGKILAGVVEYLMTQLIGSLASLGLRKLGCAYPHGIKDWSKIGDGVKKECEESLSGSSAADSVEAVEAAVDTAIGEGAGMEPLEGEPTEEAEEAGEEAEDAGDEAGEAGEEGGETPAASTDSPLPQKSLYSHICGLTMAMLIWQDVGDWLDFESDFDLNYYEQQLSDPDYCGG